MSTVKRTAGVDGTFPATFSQQPVDIVPTVTIYSNAARTVVAQAERVLVATANPSIWTASYEDTLAAGTYYLSFKYRTVIGGPNIFNNDDELVLEASDVSVAENYCSRQDVRDYGVSSDEVTDAKIDEAIELASREIDNYCGTLAGTFSAATSKTVTIHDVRTPLVSLSRFGPFSAISQVTLNGRVIDASAYNTDETLLRLYIPGIKDVDGFPVSNLALHPNRGPYGAAVAVTAVFGYASIPSPVRKACVIIATYWARFRGDEPLALDTLQPSETEQGSSDEAAELAVARKLLNPYRVPQMS